MIDQNIYVDIPGFPDEGANPRKSLRRSWNQLSRFQRNLIFTILVALCLTFIVVVSNNKESKRSVSDVDSQQPYNQHVVTEVAEELLVPAENVLALPKPGGNPIGHVPQVYEPQSEEEEEEVQQQPQPKDSSDNNSNLINPPIVESVIAEAAPKEQEVMRPDPSKEPMVFRGPTNARQTAVVTAFKHAWKGYKQSAWGHDNLKPITGGYSDWFGLGLTIIDALDTLYIMNLSDEFAEARAWVADKLTFEKDQEVNLFETTIRVLGGLLSTYHLSADSMFLDKATDLGFRLMPAFNSPSGIPFSDTNLMTLKAHAPRWSPDSSTSEVTTIQLEFRDLSRVTGDDRFERAVQAVNAKVHVLPKKDGLVPIFINANTGTFRSSSTISLGARGDSYYEYLLKQWLQTGKRDTDFLIDDYVAAIEGVLTHLVKTTPKEKHVYVGELINGKEFKPKMDHLTCYLPGTLLLGYKNGMPDQHLTLARDLLETCYQTYMRQPTHLAPEITYFNLNGEADQDMYVKANDAHNLLRPEFVESLYYFYALTGNRTYQDMGWAIFEAFEKYTRVPNGGYTSIGSVKTVLQTRPRDMMESFFLGETLKYFYLLFSDDRKEIDLEKFVFNTEAHPFPIRNY